MKDKISIITTFYNCEKFIVGALESINLQKIDDNLVDVEYILVNDCSTDKSYEVVIMYLTKYFTNNSIHVKLLETEKNIGCGAARKFGIDNATGNYFMFLDGDDYYTKNDFVMRAYLDITTNDADIVEYGIIINSAKNGKKAESKSPNKMIIEDSTRALIMLFKYASIRFNVWNKIYKESIVHSYPYNTTRTYEDIRTIPFWIKNAKKIVIMPSSEVNWRANTSSIIRNNNIDTRIGTCTALCELCENFSYSKEIIDALYRRAMIDFSAILDNHDSDYPGFNELSKLNTKMLSYIYPDDYEKFTYNVKQS